MIAVKPGDVAGAVGQAVAAGAPAVLSIAAGVSIAALEAAAGAGVAVVRAMPNTPALVGQGASAIAGGDRGDRRRPRLGRRRSSAPSARSRASTSATSTRSPALTGSGPAYLFLVAEALIDAGVARRPAAAAGRGADDAAASSARRRCSPTRGDPAALRAMVTSPAGTTAAGLHVLEARRRARRVRRRRARGSRAQRASSVLVTGGLA